jgi:two-component system sensor histidine kinase KdpD
VTVSNDSNRETGASTRLFPKGHLKIFLGASPGVGKTYAMLQAAAERKSEGVDVVVALVETHKRKETEDQLKNLEVLPRKNITYRNRTFKELDVDGVLARAPKLVLIDECAHSNLPGSRHPKRYNDISEILEQGIDVYTTVNIQHFESLKDIIEQMTHVTIRETIPDSFVQSADEVQLIDLPPDDLLQRLADGKVYVPEQAKEAIEHFFTRSNLLTLRELALRHTVTIADEKMAQYVQQWGIKGPWPASDKVMVCVGTDPSSANLVRNASRIAERLQAKWIAITVETADDENRTLVLQQQLSYTLQLAEGLGAEVVALDGIDVAQTLAQYALANNVTDLIIGQRHQAYSWHKIPLIGPVFAPRSIAEQILALHPSLTVRVIPTEESERLPLPKTQPKSLFLSLLPYFFSIGIMMGMLFAAEKISTHTKITDVSTFFLLSILWVSIQFELWPALLATILGSLVYDYNYIEPKYGLGISSLEGWVVVLSFCFTTFVVSNLAMHSRNVLVVSQGRLRQLRFFSNFTNQLTQLSTRDQILKLLCKELHRFLTINVIAFWDIHESLKPQIQYPKTRKFELADVDESAIQWALAHQKRSGRSTDNFTDAHYLYIPIKIGKNSLGVVGIWAMKDSLTIDDFRIAQTLIDQSALAIDRLSHLKIDTKNKD